VHIQNAFYRFAASFAFAMPLLHGADIPIPFGKHANAEIVDNTPASDGKGGWSDQGRDNSPIGFPTGDQQFGGVSFSIPEQGNSILRFKGGKMSGLPGIAESVVLPVPVNKGGQSLCLLACSVWGAPDKTKAAEVTVTYQDGKQELHPIEYQKHIGNWWAPQDLIKAKVGWKGHNGYGNLVGAYLVALPLRRHTVPVKSVAITANSATDASLMVLGLSLSDQPAAKLLPMQLHWEDWEGNSQEGWFQIENKYDLAKQPAPWEKAFAFFDQPAGSSGWTTTRGEDFVFEKAPGKPVRFKGVCVCGSGFRPFTMLSPRIAKIWRKYGYNQARFHSLFDELYVREGNYTLPRLNEKRMKKFDKLFFELKKAGIYVKISGIFTACWGESTGVMDYDKIQRLNCTQYYYDPKHQQVYLDALKLFLTHKNPYTGLTYAEDPAFNMYKTINESSLFFNTVDASPGSYRIMLQDRFNDWLKEKYGDMGTLLEAWRVKGEAQPANIAVEDLNQKTIALLGIGALSNCAGNHVKRAADQTKFYYELEVKWFKMVETVFRDLGSKTLIQGSSWGGPGHLQELQSAANATQDFHGKHTYWLHPHGGWTPTSALFANQSVFFRPFDHMLMCAYQHVAGKPMAITEWGFCFPNDYTIEAAPFMAVYARLQNINATHRFVVGGADLGSSKSSFFSIFNSPAGLAPEMLAYFLYVRGDLKSAPVVYRRPLTDETLHDPLRNRGGKKLDESTNRFYMKFGVGSVPAESMLAGGVRLSLDSETYPPMNDQKAIQAAHEPAAGTVTSITREVVWNYKKGYSSFNTPKTRGLMGFVEGTHEFGGLTCRLSKAYAVVGMSSIDDKPLEESSEILLTLSARDRNSGQELQLLMSGDTLAEGPENHRVGKLGTAPLVYEPVSLDFSLQNRNSGDWTAIPIDICGRPLENKVVNLHNANGLVSGSLSNKASGALLFILTFNPLVKK
jgi:hypothetical protein